MIGQMQVHEPSVDRIRNIMSALNQATLLILQARFDLTVLTATNNRLIGVGDLFDEMRSPDVGY